LSVTAIAEAGSRYRRLRVTAVIEETHDAKSFVFEVPQDQAEAFRYRPGQFLTLRLPVAGRHLPRCYSMSSAPGLDAAPRVTVKRVDAGRGSNWLCDQIKVGDSLELLPPAGQFTPRTLVGDFLLFAGGSGITPVYSILRSVLEAGSGRVLLFYANRDQRSVIFAEPLDQLLSQYPQRLQVIHWLDSVQGIPSLTQLAEAAKGWNSAQAFICGPGPFMLACEAALSMLGMASDMIHVERFASLPDEEDLLPSAAVPAVVDSAQVEIHYLGQVLQLECGGNESVLDAALRQKIELPHSCMAGMCAACMCQLQSGTVQMRVNDVLDEKDLSRGWILACQAVPTSQRLTLKFAE